MAERVKGKKDSPPILLFLGVGYVACASSTALSKQGYRLFGTIRSRTQQAGLEALGVEPVLWPSAAFDKVLAEAHHVICSAPPDAQGDVFLRHISGGLSHMRCGIYLSATSVYGGHQGAWVNELTAPRPLTTRGIMRLQAEQAWQACGMPAFIFRLAGIYGPALGGRSRNVFSRLKSNKVRAVIKPGHMVNRIHVQDIVAAILRALEQPHKAGIYNLADDMPAPPQDVLHYAADMLGLVRPPEISYNEAGLSDMALSFYTEAKRITNHKAKQVLNWQLQYPTYKEGLKAVLKVEQRNEMPDA